MAVPSTDQSAGDSRERRLKLAAGVLSVVTLLYGILIAGQILLPVVVILGGFVVYLLWRFVRAHERLAAAAERIADAQTAVDSMDRPGGRAKSPRQTSQSGDDEAEDGNRETQ